MPLIKTFEEACQVESLDPAKVVPYLVPADSDQESINAYAKLIVIIRVLNEGWVPDWSNRSEYKYQPWFKYESGFGLSYYAYVFWRTIATAGSRLCFKTSKLAEYAGKQFRDIYNTFLNK